MGMLIDTAQGAADALARTTHSGFRKTSKMLGTYLADIEELVRVEDGERALLLARLLPHIAAALESATMTASCEQADAWVERWLLTDLTPEERAVRFVAWHQGCSDVATQPEEMGVRQLRLRRHARESSVAWIRRPQLDLAPPRGSDARLALDLAIAAREWYAESAIDDAHVQSNLARIAVLR
jgi:hypothetical protein